MLKDKAIKIIVILLVSGLTAYHILSWTRIPIVLSDFINLKTSASEPSKLSTGNSTKAPITPINSYAEPPVEIKIPSVKVDLSISLSRYLSDNAWNISPNMANFAENTALPNPTKGNTVIFGHDLTNVFEPIHNIKVNDMVFVYTKSNIFTYKVSRTDIVPGNAVQIMNQTDKPLLTMFTCDGWFYQNRFAAFANLVNIKNR